MKIQYNILWFDDHPETITDEIRPETLRFLAENGFEGTFDIFEEYNERPSHEWNKYDLIVTDLNLGTPGGRKISTSGRTIIEDVRTGQILTDVLIYSANPQALESALREGRILERVSIWPGRAELEDKLKEVILLTIKKAQSIPYVRGQFIAQAIDLESQMLALLKHTLASDRFSSITAPKLKTLAEYKKRKAKFHENRKSSIETFDEKNLHQLSEQTFVDAFDRQDLARDMLKNILVGIKAGLSSQDQDLVPFAKNIDVVEKVVTECADFNADVIRIRNTLAHVKAEVVDGLPVIKGRSGDGTEIIIDDTWCREQRTSLRKHVTNLEMILGFCVT